MPSLQTALPPELANNVRGMLEHFHESSKLLTEQMHRKGRKLYRECLRRAKFIGEKEWKSIYDNCPEKYPEFHTKFDGKKHNTELLVSMVREQFKRHKHETDPEKIQKLKDDAARGLINHMIYESESMTGRKFSTGSSS